MSTTPAAPRAAGPTTSGAPIATTGDNGHDDPTERFLLEACRVLAAAEAGDDKAKLATRRGGVHGELAPRINVELVATCAGRTAAGVARRIELAVLDHATGTTDDIAVLVVRKEPSWPGPS